MQVLFSRHRVRVFRFLLRYIRDEASAEDVLADVFLDVWRQAGRFEGRSSVSTWVLSMARFKALSRVRQRSDAPLDEDYAAGIATKPTTRKSTSPSATRARRCEIAWRNCRSIIARSSTSSITTRNRSRRVAQIVGIPAATVKTRLFYARQKLSEILKAAGVDRGWP